MKLKKGDNVVVLAGKDKGASGKIERVYSKQNKVLIPKINVYKKHIKKSESAPQGGVVEVPRPLDVAKVGIKCGKCGKVTRIGYSAKGTMKVRICKKCNQEL